MIANFLSILVPIFILYRMYKENFYSLMPIIVPFFGVFIIGISVAYLETGVYSSELFLTTQQTGATVRYVLAISAFLMAYWFIFKLIVNKKWIAYQKNRFLEKRNIEIINKFIVIIGIATAILFLSYVPREVVGSRNIFLVENPSIVRDFIWKYMPFIGLYLGFAAGSTKSSITRIYSYMGIILIVLALYGFGHKASAIFSFICNFIISFFILVKFIPMRRQVFRIELRGQLIFAVIAMILIIVMGIYRYVDIAEYNITEYLINRIFVLQGSIWWFTDYETFHGLGQINIIDFIDFIFSIDYEKNLSLIYLMTKAIGTDLTYRIVFIHHGLYTGAFPASFYIFGGEGPVLFSILSGIVIAVASGYLVRKLIKRQIILSAVSFYIYIYMIAILESGEFMHLLTIKLIMYVLLLFFLEFIYYMGKKSFAYSKGLTILAREY
jgi:hypothetical protein